MTCSFLRTMLITLVLVCSAISTARAQNPAALSFKQQGDDLLKAGAVRPAMQSYQQAINIDRDYMEAYGALSALHLRTKQYGKAEALLQKALKRNAKYAEGWYNLAYSQRKQKKLAPCIKAYREYAKLKPAAPDAYFGLGLALKDKGDKKAALEAFRKYTTLEKRPDRKQWVGKAKAHVTALSAELNKAAAPPPKPAPVTRDATITPPAVAAAPKPAGTLTMRQQRARQLKANGDQLVKAGRLKQAVANYQAAVRADPNYTEAYSELGTAMFGLGRFKQATRPFRQALRDNPGYHQGWYNLAYALRKSGRNAKAIGAYRKFLQAKPNEADPYYGLGLAYRAMKNKKMALWSFKAYIAKERRPSQARWVHKAKVVVARMEGTPPPPAVAAKSAARDQRQADLAAMATPVAAAPAAKAPPAKVRSGFPEVVPLPDTLLGPPQPKRPAADAEGEVPDATKLALAGKHRAAYKKFVRVVKADPFNIQAFDGLVFCAYKLKAYRQGIGSMKMAVRDNPGYARGWLYKGRIERIGGQVAEAAGSYRRYLRKHPKELDVWLELARTLKAAKMTQQAKGAYEHYLRKEKRKDAAPKVMAAHLELTALGGKPPQVKIRVKGIKRPLTIAQYHKRKAAAEKAAAAKAAVVVSAPAVASTTPAAGDSHTERLAKAVAGDVSKAPPQVQKPDSPGDVVKSATVAARSLVTMADQAFGKRHFAVALGLYHQASKLDPSNTEALYKAGVAAMSLGQMKRAARMFGIVLKLDPKNRMAEMNLKLALGAAARTEAAAKDVQALQAAIEADLRRRRYTLAENKANKALEAAATARSFYLRARARLGLRRARAALDDGGRALALNPGLADAIKLMGDAHRALRNKPKALVYYRLYLAKTAGDVRHARGRRWVGQLVKRMSR